MARVGLSAYLMLVTMGTLSKILNKSLGWAIAVGTASAIAAEIIGRKFAGRNILPISKKEAAALEKEENKPPSEPQSQAVGQRANNLTFKSFTRHNSGIDFKGEEPQNKSNLALNFLTAFAALAVTGLILSEMKASPYIKPYFKRIKKMLENAYSTLLTKEIKMSRSRYNEIIKTLKGKKMLTGTAERYEKIVSKYNKGKTDDIINLGRGKRLFKPLIDAAIIFPVNVIKSLLTLPYKLTFKLPSLIYRKGFMKGLALTFKTKKLPYEPIYDIRTAMMFIDKNLDKKNLIEQKLLASNDSSTRTAYRPTQLGNWMKLIGSAFTGLFLVWDSYNLVMRKTKGNDEDFAYQKGKERAVQEVSRNIFSSYLVKLFNDSLKTIYNSSILGLLAVTSTNVALYEYLTRKSVGLPVRETTKNQIIEMEKSNEEKKGLWGKYYSAMQYLTGKKSLSERAHDNDKSLDTSLYSRKLLADIRFTQSPVFASFIKKTV